MKARDEGLRWFVRMLICLTVEEMRQVLFLGVGLLDFEF
jgi:hypothetical protein